MLEKFQDLLGKVPDVEIAKEFNLSRERIRQYRVKFNIPAYQKTKDKGLWTKENLELLGTMPDTVIADMLKAAVHTVSKKRVDLGIPTFLQNTNNKIVPLLGTMSDKKVAEQCNVSKATIFSLRKRLGIEANPHRYSRWNRPLKWTPNQVALLGTMSDSALAKELGVKTYIVTNERRRLGIQRFTKQNWTEQNLKLLGTMPDWRVATMLGLSKTAVWRKRKELGIKSYGRS